MLPLPIIWLGWRHQHPTPWPLWLPSKVLRYPPLADLKTPSRCTPSHSPNADRLFAVALLLFVLALSQPIHLGPKPIYKPQTGAADLILLVGTSVTMTLRDYQINGKRVDRMTMARTLLDPFIRDYPGQRMGLVLLGDPSAVWLPLTTDKHLIRNAVSRLQTTLGGRLMNLGAALDLSVDQFPQQSNHQQVIVVVSDGSMRWGSKSPIKSAQAAHKAGFSVYTIAIGSADGSAGEDNRVGRQLYSPIDLNLLAETAKAGGGKLFHALDSNAFSAALNTISKRHQYPLAAKAMPRSRTLYYPLLLLLSLMTLLGALLLPVLSSQDRQAS